ncbi:hypothetical protein LTR37_012033 [Vermiconidia calcicola]|uniref:Uncharacterized protein n=1 Tax=Vermiconidia calcicola TaxID=1690605 RepID=A0ACC3N087_9PEZI|nr:hypothetical protein LTR37_012033 [Vermiconidia calcicola]
MALLLALPSFATVLAAQEVPITPQSNTWNSSFSLSSSQIDEANLDNITASNVNVAINFERTNWATGSVHNDPFYAILTNSSHLPPGSLLKTEEYTNTSLYTLPPKVALSRILFQSEMFNGSTVPASAYVLWPWMPRVDPQTGKYAVVGWAHGTSGVNGDCAPSHIRNLWYQYSAPYILALQGYVVVAPDYQGLGVDRRDDGSDLRHPYLNNVAAANDLFYSIEAAQNAFSEEFSSNFVLFGHSQVEGYLGTITGSPTTNIIEQQKFVQNPRLPFNIGYGLPETLPGFEISEFLTEKGVRHSELLQDLGACNSAVAQLVVHNGLIKDDWQHTPSMQLFVNLTGSGGRPITGPMLIIQGTEDSAVPYQVTSNAVSETCNLDPQTELEYAVFEGSEHVPVLISSQQVWLDWIYDRFAGQEPAGPCKRTFYIPARKVEGYQKQLEYYLELATQAYEVA